MKLTSMRCPSCGAEIQIPEGKPFFFCTFCGTQIHVEDGTIRVEITKNVNIENRYVDVARLRQLELQEQERLRNEQKREEEKRQEAELEEAEQKKEKTDKQKWISACTIWAGGVTTLCVVLGLCAKIFGELNSVEPPLSSLLAVVSLLFLIVAPCVLGAKIPESFFEPGKYPSVGKRIACGFGLGFAFMFLLGGILSILFKV